MNRKPLAQQKEEATVEKVFASRRTRESRGSFDNANEHARQREEDGGGLVRVRVRVRVS